MGGNALWPYVEAEIQQVNSFPQSITGGRLKLGLKRFKVKTFGGISQMLFLAFKEENVGK